MRSGCAPRQAPPTARAAGRGKDAIHRAAQYLRLRQYTIEVEDRQEFQAQLQAARECLRRFTIRCRCTSNRRSPGRDWGGEVSPVGGRGGSGDQPADAPLSQPADQEKVDRGGAGGPRGAPHGRIIQVNCPPASKQLKGQSGNLDLSRPGHGTRNRNPGHCQST